VTEQPKVPLALLGPAEWPWGILGGKAGKPSDFVLNPGTERERILGNTDIVTMDPGDVLHIHSPGGGGRGDPLAREPERVLLDVERGYVSPIAAERDYGVVIRAGSVDASATARRRAALRAGRAPSSAHFSFGPEREAFARIWPDEAYAEMTRIMTELPTHWRFFVKTRLFEMLTEPAADAAAAVRRAFLELQERYPGMTAAAG
jgi:N-methylhydantoinase B